MLCVYKDLEILIEGLTLELSYEDKWFLIMQAGWGHVFTGNVSSKSRGKNVWNFSAKSLSWQE